MNKFHAVKTKVDGLAFDSLAESRRYMELKFRERAGEISGLTVHPRFELIGAFWCAGKHERPTCYVADFQYLENGKTVVEDVKGGRATRTAVFELKRKLFLFHYGNQLDFRIIES